MAPMGVILAGGAARRMGGGDKGRLDLGGRTVLEELLSRLAPQCAEVVLNANGDPARFVDMGLAVAPDTIAGLPGPLAGILAGMEAAVARGMTHILTVPADTPFIPHDLARRLFAGLGDRPVALAATSRGGRISCHPVCGLWCVGLRHDLRRDILGGAAKVSVWAQTKGAVAVPFEVTGRDPFFNINTPEDLEQARDIVRLGEARIV